MQSRRSPAPAAYQALADETRRSILEFLRGGPKTSGEIADQFHSSWPTISRHLAVLRSGGLVIAAPLGNHQTTRSQNSQMPGNGGPARMKLIGDFAGGFRPAAQELQNRAAGFVGEGLIGGRSRGASRLHD